MRSKTLPAALAALAVLAATAVLTATTMPAAAVAIRHTNRAGGDPDAATVPTGHATPPADTTGARTFDKSHDGGAGR